MVNIDKITQDEIGKIARDSLNRNAAARPWPGQRLIIENHDCRSVARGAPVAYEVQLDYTNSYATAIKAKYSGQL